MTANFEGLRDRAERRRGTLHAAEQLAGELVSGAGVADLLGLGDRAERDPCCDRRARGLDHGLLGFGDIAPVFVEGGAQTLLSSVCEGLQLGRERPRGGLSGWHRRSLWVEWQDLPLKRFTSTLPDARWKLLLLRSWRERRLSRAWTLRVRHTRGRASRPWMHPGHDSRARG